MAFVYRSDIKERHYVFIFIDYTSRHFFADYLAKNAVFNHHTTIYVTIIIRKYSLYLIPIW
jgi:hypothetical protein